MGTTVFGWRKGLPPGLGLAQSARGHPAVTGGDDAGVRTVVDTEMPHPGVGKVLRKLQQIADAGATKAVDTLVVVANHGEVAVGLSQAEQHPLLDTGGVLVLVNHQVPDGGAGALSDCVVLQQSIGSDL